MLIHALESICCTIIFCLSSINIQKAKKNAITSCPLPPSKKTPNVR